MIVAEADGEGAPARIARADVTVPSVEKLPANPRPGRGSFLPELAVTSPNATGGTCVGRDDSTVPGLGQRLLVEGESLGEIDSGRGASRKGVAVAGG